MTFISVHILKSKFKKKATFLFQYLLKCLLLILTLRSKKKKEVSEYSLVSITVEKKKKKNPCITLRLVLDFVFTSFDITPMLLNNLSNFYLHLFNLTFGLDLYLWCEMVISCKKHNVSFLRTLLKCRRPSYKILLTFN